MSYGKCASSAQIMRRERCILWTRRTALSPLSASNRRSQGCRKSMVKSCRQGILLLSLVLVLAGCRGAPPPAPTPLPTPTTAAASPAPIPSPRPWPEGVLFYELEEPEQTCLGYQEYLSFRETITQIKIVCTQQGVETVYFIDTEKQVVTIVRIPIPLTVKPQE